jgi:5-methylcytosine-specific restriction protein A
MKEDKRSPRARKYRGWYRSEAWQRIRAKRLKIEPWCRMCAEQGIRTKADIVDHVTPHRGDRTLFFCFPNTQSLDKACHDSRKQQIERIGYHTAIDSEGLPLDRNHPFYK